MSGRQTVIYLDVFFMINLIMDYLVLRLTALVMRFHGRKARCFAAAVSGAFYSVLILKPLLNHFAILPLLSIITGLLMIFIAYGYQDIGTFIKTSLFFMAVVFLLGGVMNYLYYATEMGVCLNALFYGSSPGAKGVRKFLFVTAASYGLTVCILKLAMIHKKNRDVLFEVRLCYRRKTMNTMALLDTGNHLTEPFTHRSVHIVESRLMKTLLEGDEDAKEKIYVIPYHSLGKEHGILYGVEIDEMVVIINGNPQRIPSPLMGIYHGTLSPDGQYSVILNGDLPEQIG